jgi:hypothetical protein
MLILCLSVYRYKGRGEHGTARGLLANALTARNSKCMHHDTSFPADVPPAELRVSPGVRFRDSSPSSTRASIREKRRRRRTSAYLEGINLLPPHGDEESREKWKFGYDLENVGDLVLFLYELYIYHVRSRALVHQSHT